MSRSGELHRQKVRFLTWQPDCLPLFWLEGEEMDECPYSDEDYSLFWSLECEALSWTDYDKVVEQGKRILNSKMCNRDIWASDAPFGRKVLAAYIESMMDDNEEKSLLAHPDWPCHYPHVNWRQFLDGPKRERI